MKRSRSTKRTPSKARGRRATPWALHVLTADEAHGVLRKLLSTHPALVPDAEQAASGLLATVSFVVVAENVFRVVQALDWDDLRAGPQPDGYIEPSEAAWEAVENSVKPYLDDLQRRICLKHEEEAFEVCKGIVVGLYRARHASELLDHAEDCPVSIATRTVEMWRRRNRDRTFRRTFVERFAPEWDWLTR